MRSYASYEVVIMGRKKTHEEFAEEVCDLVGNEYKVLDKYLYSRTKIKIKHDTCGYIYHVTPNKFLTGRRCPKCSGLMKKTHEEFTIEIFNLVGNEYSVISNYINTSTKIKMKHNDCGRIYDVTPDSFLGTVNKKGTRCPECYKVKNKKSLQKRGKKQSDNYKKLYFKKLKEIHNGHIMPISDYVTYKSKIKVRCDRCENVWETRASSLICNKEHGCPNCNKFKSKGVIEIEGYLINENLFYLKEFSYRNCKNKHVLPFDFLVFDQLLIEFDGGQHFMSVDYFGGRDGFKYRRCNDEIKNQYCIDNNIPLIRIPYWEKDNIEYILENVLAYFNIHKINKEIDKEVVERYLVDSKWNHDTYLSWQHKENRFWIHNSGSNGNYSF